MEECESLDSEMTELQGFQSEANSQDDDDEVEELQNSLREVVQDQSVKPKLQCLMVDPSFSMVTVQSEDSGIVWETASSRCSTPWASETSSTSEAYSMEGSGAAGKITIVFDEEKIVRRRTRSGGRSSRLGDRLSRPGSSRSASALGVERPEMAEVSLPNVKQEKTQAEPDLEEIKNKDQQLFSLISEGYEILNIRVPSKLPTVDEEESTELQDNLAYLDQTPRIRSKNHHDRIQQENHVLLGEQEMLDHEKPSEQDSSADAELSKTPTPQESTSDIDYFEKFTLVDVVVPEEQAPEKQPQEEAGNLAGKPQEEEQKPIKETATDSPAASEESFVFVTDVEIVGEHLDEVFYGEGAPPERRDDDEEGEGRMRMRRESQRSVKESGSVLFGSQETILTPIFISPGPPKIIDQILLDEPTAMSFMYSDLYEDAVGERRRSDEEYSEAESVASEKSYKRRFSDSEEADGYLEKFTLKDDIPAVEDRSEPVDCKAEGRMMWSQNKFEMTGCLTRAVRDKTQEVSVEEKTEKVQSAGTEKISKTEKEKDDIKLSLEDEGLAERQFLGESVQESKPAEDHKQVQEVKPDHDDPPDGSTDQPLLEIQQVDTKAEKSEESEGHLREVPEETTSILKPEPPCQTQEEVEKARELVADASEVAPAAPVSSEVSHSITESEVPESSAKIVSEEATTDAKIAAPEEEVASEVALDVAAEVKETESDRQDQLTSADIQTPAETFSCEETDAADLAPVEVTTDCDSAVHAVVEVIEKVVDEKEIQTQVQIDLQEVTSAETRDAQKEAAGEESGTKTERVESTAPEVIRPTDHESENKTEVIREADAKTERVESMVPYVTAETDLKSECKAEVSGELEEAKTETAENQVPEVIRQTDHQSEGKTEVISEPEAKTETAVVPEIITQTAQESGDTSELSREPEEAKTESDQKQHEIIESKQRQQEEEPEAANEAEKSDVETVVKEKTPAVDSVSVVQEMVNVGDELIVLVPRGQAVEMDIELSQGPEKAASDTAALSEPTGPCEPETITISPESLEAPGEEIMADSEQEVKPEVDFKEEMLPPGNELDNKYTPPAPVEDVQTDEQKMEHDFEEDEGFFSPLRSFTPHEDLSGLHMEDLQAETPDIGQRVEVNKVEDASETNIIVEELCQETDLQKEEVGQKMELDEVVAEEAPELSVEELDYEMITEQDAIEMLKQETQEAVEEPQPEISQNREERTEMDMEVETKMEKEREVFDMSPKEELIEADYEIIDAEEENQARLAAELQGMDWYCLTCGCLLSEENCSSGEHQSHEVTAVDKAYEDIKEKLSDWISELQGRSENIEDLVSELELGYNSVEDQCVETEAAIQAQNDEMMALVMEQYNTMSVSMEEEKKAKLEQLYDQIVSFQESIDSTKATLETTAREAETDARSPEDIHLRLKAALDSAMSLELGPKGLLVFEDYAKGNTSSSHAQRKGIQVPQRPTLQTQEPGSASSTSVTVYWKVNPGDIIDCFQVYCMEDPQGAVSEEYRVTVKESYCVLEELEPDKTYKVWVMAVNYTGCSLPSERLSFRTAPSVPVINTERCSVLWDSAMLRWSSEKQNPEQSYTLEYCRQYELEGEGLRSISGIRSCEQKVLLQPNESYLFYIKAVNEAGASEQSEAALISTKGTRFQLLKASAHPALELSVDETTVHYSEDSPENTLSEEKVCPSILGELFPAKGNYYWETTVTGCTAYRLGVACSPANRNSPLGENSLSWCLQCVPTPSGYQLLHNDMKCSLLVVEMPERVGTLLDYQHSRLSFYNAQSGQVLGSFCQRFTQQCHPALALETPGCLEVSMVPEVPEFTKDS